MRIFRNMQDCVQEIDRELLCSGISVEIEHYQNQKLEGADRNTKELMGVAFTISKPLEKRLEAIQYLFGDDAERIERYCKQEFADRVSGESLNPGNSYKIRLDLWQAMMSKKDGEKFDYSYSERYDRFNGLQNAIDALLEDKHTRQSMLQIYHPDLDSGKHGGNTRIPCSVDYQFLIRNNRLYCVYHMRSSDMLSHLVIDLWLSAELIKYVTEKIKVKYPEVKPGSLLYFAGSLHAYAWDLRKRVIF